MGVKFRWCPGFGLLLGLDGGCVAGELLSEFESLAACIGQSDHRIASEDCQAFAAFGLYKGW